MDDDRPHIAQWLEPRRRQKSPARLREEESRRAARARGGHSHQWQSFFKPFLLSILAFAAFLVAIGVANVILSGAP